MKTDENYKGQDDTKELVDVIGYFGPWQRRIFFITFISLVAHCWHVLAMLFLAPNVDHWCQRPTRYSNISTDQWKALAIPRVQSKNGSDIYSSCLMYTNFTSHMEEENSTTTCTSWEYDNSYYTSTIIDEWDLVCENDWLPSMSTSVYMGGFMASVFISGQLSDRYGRRPVILVGGIIFLVSGFACAFSTSFLMFTILRFLVAFGASGTVLTVIILLLEVVGPDYRTILGICYQFGWALGYTILPGVAFLVKKWRHFQLIISVPWILLCSIWWFLPESPRWLLSQGKVELAEREIRNAARLNGKTVSNWQVIMSQLVAKEKQEEEMKRNRQATFLDLLKTPNMRKKSLNNFLFWFVNAFTYYGLSLHTNDMGGNPLITFFIAGSLEFPANIIAFILIKYVGRRISLMVMMVTAGIACLLTVPVPDNLLWLRITLAMTGKLCIASSFSVIYIYSAELFPTVVRNIGLGSCSMSARIGSMIAPFVKELGKATSKEIPLGIFGGLSIISGLLVIQLPETNKLPIPDTLAEGEEIGKGRVSTKSTN